jgi:hypothetical protein
MIKAFSLPGYSERQDEFVLSETDSEESDFEGFTAESIAETVNRQLD